MEFVEIINEIKLLRNKAISQLEEKKKEIDNYFLTLEEERNKLNAYSGLGEVDYKIFPIVANPLDEISQIKNKIEELDSRYNDHGFSSSNLEKLNEIYVELKNIFFSRCDSSQRNEVIKSLSKKWDEEIEKLYKQACDLSKNVTQVISENKELDFDLTPNPEFPKTFPEDVFLNIGKYEIDEEIKESGVEQKFNTLIGKITRANRGNDIFGIDVSNQNGNSNLLIFSEKFVENESIEDKALVVFLKTVLYKFIVKLPRSAKKIFFIQNRRLSKMQGFLSNLYSDEYKSLIYSQNDNGSTNTVIQDPMAVLRPLIEEMQRSNALLDANGEDNIFNYNLHQYKNGIWQPQILLMIKDFPCGFDETKINCLGDVLQQASNTGITVVMTVCKDFLEKSIKNNENLSKGYERVFSYFNKKLSYSNQQMIDTDSYEKISFNIDAFAKDKFNFELFKSCLTKHMMETDRDPYIPLRTIINLNENSKYNEKDDRRLKFSRELILPVGRCGTEIFTLDIHSDSAAAHTVIAGMTGSGKSVLLHNIILSAVSNYTPDEVELYLFDFKQTPGGFERYVKRNIPHIKVIGVNSEAREINLLLNQVKNIYTERMNLVRQVGCSNIIEYNKKITETKQELKKIPRVLVIIDEYHSINDDESIEILDDIARKGREYGVSIIMASQKGMEARFSKVLSQFYHRFEFKNEPLGELINSAIRVRSGLDGPRGLCCYAKGSGGLPVIVRAAFDGGGEELKKLFEYVEKCSQNWKEDTFFVGAIKTGLIRQYDYDETGKVFISKKGEDNKQRIYPKEYSFLEEYKKVSKEKFTTFDDDKRGYSLWVGMDNITFSPIVVNLDYMIPNMILYGGYERMKGVEYSIIKCAYESGENLGEDKEQIFYFNGRKKINPNCPISKLQTEKIPRTVFYNQDDFVNGIDHIYEIYKNRSNGVDENNYPILIMFSDIVRALNEIKADVGNTETLTRSFMRTKFRNENGSNIGNASRDLGTNDKIETIIRKGKEVNIFIEFLFVDNSVEEKTKRIIGSINPHCLYVFPEENNEKDSIRQALGLFEKMTSEVRNINIPKNCFSYLCYKFSLDSKEYLTFLSYQYNI